MSRAKAVPSYCLHKASGRAYVKIKGKRIYLGLYGSDASRAEYRRILGEIEILPAAAVSSAANRLLATDLTVNELAEGFIDHAAGYYRRPDGEATSEVLLVKVAVGVACSLYGHAIAADFGPIALKAVRQAMIAKGWARTSINQHVGRIVRMFRWAVENELVGGSTLHALRAVQGLRAGRSDAKEPEPVRPVSDAVVDATIPFLPSPVAAMVRLQRLTGMRPGEVCQMRPSDIDRSGAVWIYTPPTHKTQHHGKARTILLGPRAKRILAPFLKDRLPQANLFSPAEAMAELHARRSVNRKTPNHYLAIRSLARSSFGL